MSILCCIDYSLTSLVGLYVMKYSVHLQHMADFIRIIISLLIIIIKKQQQQSHIILQVTQIKIQNHSMIISWKTFIYCTLRILDLSYLLISDINICRSEIPAKFFQFLDWEKRKKTSCQQIQIGKHNVFLRYCK